MRSVRVALGLAVALLAGGLGSAAAQTGAEDAFNSRQEPSSKRRGVDKTAPRAEKARPEAATPATPAVSAAEKGSGPATPATPAVPAAPLVPPGLSGRAPETAPNVGVIGGGGKGGSSPAATPEPTTLLLMGAGLAGVYGLRRRRQ